MTPNEVKHKIIELCWDYKFNDTALALAFAEVESSFNLYATRYESKWVWFFEKGKSLYDKYKNFTEFFILSDFRNMCKAEYDNQLDFHFASSSLGCWQLMGSTARWLGFIGQFPQLFNIQENFTWFNKYYNYLFKKYNGIMTDIISAYNQGSARKDDNGLYYNQEYVNKVLDAWTKYKREIKNA